MAESAVRVVLGNVGNLTVQEAKFLCGVTNEVAFLKDELMRLQGYLRDADSKQRSGNTGVAILVSQIREAACDAENAIEAAEYIEKRNRIKNGFMGAISRYARLPSDLVTLHNVGVDIKRVRRKLSEIFASAQSLKIDLDNDAAARCDRCHAEDDLPQDYSLVKDSVVMVGFDDEHKEIVDILVGKQNMLSAVSIVAMGGAGKTTLARKVYTSSRVKKHFEAVAWVTVSQNFKGIDLLKDILKQINGAREESIDRMQEYEVAKKISDFLLLKRYLIVLDDVWETDTWDKINSMLAFPDGANRSRILLTTRSKHVAVHIRMETHVHDLKQLDEEKSWELFSSKALPPYQTAVKGDRDEFIKLGRKLARKCDGLPLALAVLGGYLSKNFDIQSWSDVLLSWPSTKDTHMMREILARSYKDLPSHYLRSCFLYFASFPEDYIIDVSDLIELWIAESFIPHMRNHKLEETARNYVTELAQRSLVQVVDRCNVHGWIERIRIHDILSDWCIKRAREDGFLDVIDKTTGQTGASSSDTTRAHRSSFQNLSGQILEAAPKVRTVLCFGISLVSMPKLRFLRVLNIQNTRLKHFSSAICGCIHLRCLRLRNCEGVALPSSIGQLIYLQTLDLRDTILDSELPKSLWEIATLRHVFLQNGFCPPPLAGSKRPQLQKELQTMVLGIPFVATKKTYDDMVIFLGQMNQLTTLYLPMRKIPGVMINMLEKMPDLVDVYISRFYVIDKLPAEFPQSLRRLVLEADNLTQDPMPILEKLPYLVVLELTGHTGETISCSGQGFPRLQRLKLGDFRGEWNMEVGAMSRLSQLLLCKYSYLDGLPEALLHIRSLNYIGLTSMPWITEDNDSTLKELLLKGCEVKRDEFVMI